MSMIDCIYKRLQQQFSPSHLEVKDDREQHQGHAMYGAGHYTVIIAADCFKNKSRLKIHRAIYAALSDWIPEKIHALSIQCQESENQILTL